MKQKPANWGWVVGVIYAGVLLYLIHDIRRASDVRTRRLDEFQQFSKLLLDAPQLPAPPAAGADVTVSEPLLVRLQKAIEQNGLKDRSPKLSSGPATPNSPASTTLSMEGVPVERIAYFLEQLSIDPAILVPAFKLERSGASDERFDLSTTLVEYVSDAP